MITHRMVGAVPCPPVSLFQAFVLGLVQGLSEFLPISSSGHLILVPWLFGWDTFAGAENAEELKKAFDVSLHAGTLVAVVAYFRRDIVIYVREGLRLVFSRERPTTPDGRVAWLLVVATVPAAIVGAIFEQQIDTVLGEPWIIAVSLIVFGVLLWWADQRMGKRTIGDMRFGDAVKIGAAQALALNPGTSRSGITITAARQIGFERDAAARISFLMSLPVITGAVVLKMGRLVVDGIPDGMLGAMIVGIVTSGVSGWFAVWGTLRLIRTRSFTPFVVYRIVVGVAVLVILATPWR
jgi:undecaprenyl-diphosphatase